MRRRALVVAGAVWVLWACGGSGRDTAAAPRAPDSVAPADPTPATRATVAGASTGTPKSATVDPCLLTAAELTQALGSPVRAGVPNVAQWSQYNIADCTYAAATGGPTVTVVLTWLDPQYLEQTKASMMQFDAATLERVAGDPDDAYLQYQESMRSGALHYVHGNTMVEIRPTPWKGSRAELKTKLLSLRRIP